VAVLDPARRRVIVEAAELDAAMTLFDDPVPAPATDEESQARAALVAAGLVRGERMGDVLAELLAPLVAPVLSIVVETHLVAAAITARIWATAEQGTRAVWVADDRWELQGVAPRHVPLVLLDVLGFGERPPPEDERPLRVPGPVLRAGWAAAATGSDERIVLAALAGSAALDPGDRARFARLLAERRSSWRVTVAYAAAGGELRQGSLTVVDAGAAGCWVSEPLDPADPEAGAILSPRRSSAIWHDLLELIPAPRAAEAESA
jgi:hypothetical protein